jgi:putative membrane protein
LFIKEKTMENIKDQSRRKFLSASLSAAVVAGAGTTFFAALLTSEDAGAKVQTNSLQARIAMLGKASLETSKLALTKASNSDVKLFAKYEAAEQETMGKILKEMGTTVPAPGEEQKTLLSKLQSASGKAFDQAFMQGQLSTHKQLHDAVAALMKSSQDIHVRHLTSLALATITEHTERARMINGKIA